MKSRLLLKPAFVLFPLVAGLLLATGCATSSHVPRVNYPVTYQIDVGNTNLSAEGDRQDLNVVATQRLEVTPGDRIHFAVDSPVIVDVSIYEADDRGSRQILWHHEGTVLASTILPRTRALLVEFSAARSNSSGRLSFTVSDRPIGGVTTTEIGR